MIEKKVFERTTSPLTVLSLSEQLRTCNLSKGQRILFHLAISNLGWIIGGPVPITTSSDSRISITSRKQLGSSGLRSIYQRLNHYRHSVRPSPRTNNTNLVERLTMEIIHRPYVANLFPREAPFMGTLAIHLRLPKGLGTFSLPSKQGFD